MSDDMESKAACGGDHLSALEDEIARLEAELAKTVKVNQEIWDTFYGQNMELTNWHQNGDLEPIDKFFDENDWRISTDLDRKVEAIYTGTVTVQKEDGLASIDMRRETGNLEGTFIVWANVKSAACDKLTDNN